MPKNPTPITPDRAAAEIVKALDNVTASGYNRWELFDDFLDLALAALERLPEHLRSAVNREPLTDTPETAALFERLRKKYTKPYQWEGFSRALAVLLDTADEYRDTIGEVYMSGEMFSKWAGQFFTPFALAQMMAAITVDEDMVYARLTAAYERSPTGQMHRLMSGNSADERLPAFVRKMGANLVPFVAEYYEPVTVCDPCCGSGVMFLATASRLPAWMNHLGLVQYCGMDIDQTCVKMARINVLIYGLNGSSVKYALALTGVELTSIPEPYQSTYAEAQSATPERLEEITAEVLVMRQCVLF